MSLRKLGKFYIVFANKLFHKIFALIMASSLFALHFVDYDDPIICDNISYSVY